MRRKKRQGDDDPIVAEVRRARERIAKRFNYDLNAIFAYFREKTEESRRAGHKVCSTPARPSDPPERRRKAG